MLPSSTRSMIQPSIAQLFPYQQVAIWKCFASYRKGEGGEGGEEKKKVSTLKSFPRWEIRKVLYVLGLHLELFTPLKASEVFCTSLCCTTFPAALMKHISLKADISASEWVGTDGGLHFILFYLFPSNFVEIQETSFSARDLVWVKQTLRMRP